MLIKNIKIIAIQTKGFEESNGASEASVETVSSNIIAFKSAFIFKTLKVFQKFHILKTQFSQHFFPLSQTEFLRRSQF